jgi:spermidine/putrescine transport system permease protein
LWLSSPTVVLLLFFAGPIGILAWYSFGERGRTGTGALTLENYRTVAERIYIDVALDTLFIAAIAIAFIMVVAYPLAYVLAFRSGKWEVPFLLALVLADGLNPLIKIHAWRTVLGRNGLINTTLQSLGIISEPLEWLLLTKFSVVVVLATGFLPYAVMPIYAAMKTVPKSLLEASRDLGSSWFGTFKNVVAPLTATGFLAVMIIVFLPILSAFAAPALVGGTNGFMLSSLIEEEFLIRGQWGIGSALSIVLLLLSGVIVWLSYRIANIKRLGMGETGH